MASLFQTEPHPPVVSQRAAWAGGATAPLGFLGLGMDLDGGRRQRLRGVEREWVAVASGGRVGVFEFPN